MFFFFPVNTEGPLYHPPIGTGFLMTVNLAVFTLQILLPEIRWDYFWLSIGDGMHPLQWFTAYFLHADWIHIVSNMIFLWAFGLVVEGRSGLWKFLLIYCFTGVLVNLLIQLMFLWHPGTSALGASGAIFGTMAAAMLWAPKDNLVCWGCALFAFFEVRVPVLLMAAAYIMLDIGLMIWQGFELSSSLAHVMGALVGLAIAWIMLKKSWIDCDFDDLLSMTLEARGIDPKARTRFSTKQRSKQKMQKQLLARVESLDQFYTQIDIHLENQQPEEAIAVFAEAKRNNFNIDWDESRLVKLLSQLYRIQKWDLVVDYSRSYLDRFKKHRIPIQTNLAKVYLYKKGLVHKAMRVANQLAESTNLKKRQRLEIQTLINAAKDVMRHDLTDN